MSRRVRFSSALPWVFILGVAVGTMLPIRQWTVGSGPISMPPVTTPTPAPALPDHSAVWTRAGNPMVRHPVDVIRTIDGDTFEAQVHLWPGLDMTTRVRLRGIDAPELKASCPQELRMAQAAGDALRALLEEGGVTIYNIGPDKYNGRVVADAASARTPNISAALLAGGFARSYGGGHRNGWCAGANG
jgi:endonuclease YncB( thermonuclease family)